MATTEEESKTNDQTSTAEAKDSDHDAMSNQDVEKPEAAAGDDVKGNQDDAKTEEVTVKGTGKKRATSGTGSDKAGGSPIGEPKVIKKGDQVITNCVDEKTGKIAVYEIGIKLEVSDFSQPPKWFPARVVEIDSGENEILVHFENWSTRFDEWIKMDSNRLRPAPNTNIVKTTFKVGEKVEAIWGMDGQKYPGEILSVLPNDYYQVLFDDGIRYKKKYNQIFKLKMATRGGGGRASIDAPTMPPTGQPKSARPLPKLTPAPFLLGNVDGNSFGQQPVSSLPPNVPLLANSAPRGKRQPSLNQSIPSQNQARLHQDSDRLSTAHTIDQTPKPLVPVGEGPPTELGKRRRTVKNYSQLLNPNLRLSPPPHSPLKQQRRASSKVVVDEKAELPTTASEHQAPASKASKTVPAQHARKIAGSQDVRTPKKTLAGQVKGGSARKSQTSSLDASPQVQAAEDRAFVCGEKDLSFTQNTADVKMTPTSSGTSLIDTPPAHSKRKRTIHDYSMLLKSRIPKSFLATETDSPPKATRRRRKNILSESAAADFSIHDASQDSSVLEQESEMNDKPFTDTAIGSKSKDQSQEGETQMEVDNQSSSPSRRPSLKSAPVLTEFDMFAPKKKNLAPYRSNVPKSPERNKENSGTQKDDSRLQSQARSTPTLTKSSKPRRRMDSSEDDELLDLPDDARGGQRRLGGVKNEVNKESPEPPQEVVQPIVIRRPGRPFKKNKPPPGHWSYGISASTSAASSPGAGTSVDHHSKSPTKTSPPVAHHPASRLMKNLKIPIVPISSGQESNELLTGLSSAKIEKLQRKLFENDTGFCLEFEPSLKDASVDVINCACGSSDEHGFMIQCEFCHCWQHGSCNGFTEDSEMPTFYVCETCKFPFHPRESLKYEWNQEFKRKGRLPRLALEMESNHELEQMVLESAELQDRLYQILDIIHSNRVKLHIANKLPEHPKIYQWDKPSVTAGDDLKMRLYKKVYQPVLRRLLYHHRHDPGYKEHLIRQVEKRFDSNSAETVEKSESAHDNNEDTCDSNSETETDTTQSTDNATVKIDTDSASTGKCDGSSSLSTDKEIKDLLDEILKKVETIVSVPQDEETDPLEAIVRPTDLNILETEEAGEKTIAGNDSEKKGNTPLVDDLSMLGVGSIGELTSRADPGIDDLFLSIFNDPDFEKSFDAPMAPGANTFTVKEMAPPVSTPVIVPTLERITADMCRANLLNHVADQQELVDKCLQVVEDRIQAMEDARRQGHPPSHLDNLELSQLQSNVKGLLEVFELLKGMPLSNDHSSANDQSPGNENDPNVIPVALRASATTTDYMSP